MTKDQEEKPQPFKVIIAGSRSFNCFATLMVVLDKALAKRLKAPEGLVIVSGKAKGADTLGEQWAHLQSPRVPVKAFPAPWTDTEGKPKSQIGKWKDGTEYWKGAGHFRNAQMADYADGLIVFWDGKSTGTKGMIEVAEKKGLKVKIVRV